MRRYGTSSVLQNNRAATAAALLAVALTAMLSGKAQAQAQATGPLPPEHLSWYGDPSAPDLSGVWVRAPTTEARDAAATGVPSPVAPSPVAQSPAAQSKEGWTPWPPPLTPPFLATWQTRVDDAAAGKRTDDPVRACLPPGMPRFITGTSNPMLIIQTPGRVVMYREGSPVRRVWLDGRPLPSPEEVENFYQGTAAGHYEGKDLVIDTIGVKDEPIDSTGIPHSDGLKVTERFHRVDAKTLVVQVTLTDPTAYVQPMMTTVAYQMLDNPLWEAKEFICSPVTNYHPDYYVH